MNPSHWMTYESPLGPLTLVASPRGLAGLHFPGRAEARDETDRRPMPEVTAQLDAYFAGELRAFDLALDMRGTPLQLEVWRGLCEIPYGETASYSGLAARIDPARFGAELAPWRRARAIGGANGANPVAIIVPCHRVIGADGTLTGYGGGLHRKQALLELERRVAGGAPRPHEWAERQTSLL